MSCSNFSSKKVLQDILVLFERGVVCFGTVEEGHSLTQGHEQAVLIYWNEMVNLNIRTVVLLSTVWPCCFAAEHRCKLRLVELCAGFCV